MSVRKEPAAEEQSNSETRVALLSERRFRWIPFRSSRPSLQKFLGPFQCLPMGELFRQQAARQSKSSNESSKKADNAIKAPDDVNAPIVLDIHPEGRNAFKVNAASGPRASTDNYDTTSLKMSVASECPEDVATSSAENDENASNEAKPKALVTVLDVEFARVHLRRSDTWPNFEFYIEALEAIITTVGATALLDFLDFVLNLPEVVSSGFMLTYDLRNLTVPQLDLMSWIMRYITEPQHEEAWQERCICCKIIVQSGMYYSVTESLLSAIFSIYMPPCRVFLTTELDDIHPEAWRCFKPDDIDEGLGILSSIGAGFLDVLLPPFPYETPAQQRATETLKQPSRPNTSAEETKPEALDNATRPSCPASLTVEFCTISQGFDKAQNIGYLKVVGNSSPMSDECLAKVMDFMDAFVNSPNAEKGFSITYDLRKLGIPSMSQIMRVAEWGKNSVRQDKWMKLNIACRVVVTAGVRYSMTTAVLKSFFYICPPVCRTVLLSDPDAPEEDAVVFLPPADPDRESLHEDTHSDDGSNSSTGFPADASESTTGSNPACNGALKVKDVGGEDVPSGLQNQDLSEYETESLGHGKQTDRRVDHERWERVDTHSWIPDSFHIDMW